MFVGENNCLVWMCFSILSLTGMGSVVKGQKAVLRLLPGIMRKILLLANNTNTRCVARNGGDGKARSHTNGPLIGRTCVNIGFQDCCYRPYLTGVFLMVPSYQLNGFV